MFSILDQHRRRISKGVVDTQIAISPVPICRRRSAKVWLTPTDTSTGR